MRFVRYRAWGAEALGLDGAELSDQLVHIGKAAPLKLFQRRNVFPSGIQYAQSFRAPRPVSHKSHRSLLSPRAHCPKAGPAHGCIHQVKLHTRAMEIST